MFTGYHPEINKTIHNTNNYSTYYPFKKKPGLYGYPLGLFKENDWKCVNCNNINFSWRNECNRCHLEKYKNDIYQEGKYRNEIYQEGRYRNDIYQESKYKNDIYQEGKYKYLRKRQHSRSSEHFSSSKKSSFSSNMTTSSNRPLESALSRSVPKSLDIVLKTRVALPRLS